MRHSSDVTPGHRGVIGLAPYSRASKPSRAITVSMSSRLTDTCGHEGLRKDAESWRVRDRRAPLLAPRVADGSKRAESGPHERTVARPTLGRERKLP